MKCKNNDSSALNSIVERVFAALGEENLGRCGAEREIIFDALKLVEDSYVLALARHVSIEQWTDIFASAKKLMEDPEEWERLRISKPLILEDEKLPRILCRKRKP